MEDKSVKQQDAIDQQAAQWVIRLHGRGPDKNLQQDLTDWLNQHPDHRRAFAQAQTVWSEMGLLEAEATSVRRITPRRVAAMAAACVLCVCLGVQCWLADTFNGFTADYATAPGEHLQLQLADGSEVVLGPDSALNVDYRQSLRHLELKKGIAHFTVAKEPGRAFRPFVVDADVLQGKALGTQFVIDKVSDERAELIVIEHSVEVSSPNNPVVAVQQNQLLRVDSEGLSQTMLHDTSWANAWQDNRLVFNRTPLADALAKLNRYRRNKILLGRPALKDIEVTGVFNIEDTDAVLQAMADKFGFEYYAIPPFVTLIR